MELLGRRRPQGFTVVELLVVLAVLGLLFGIGFVQLQPPAARLFANDMKAMIQQARYEAVKRNRPVAVVWGADAFVMRFDVDSNTVLDTCDGDEVLRTKGLDEYRGIIVQQEPTLSLVWLPSGQGRTCSGSPAITTKLTIDDGRTTRIVDISPGGKVSTR